MTTSSVIRAGWRRPSPGIAEEALCGADPSAYRSSHIGPRVRPRALGLHTASIELPLSGGAFGRLSFGDRKLAALMT
eukprot:835514-Prymnesium_polylepis.1